MEGSWQRQMQTQLVLVCKKKNRERFLMKFGEEKILKWDKKFYFKLMLENTVPKFIQTNNLIFFVFVFFCFFCFRFFCFCFFLFCFPLCDQHVWLVHTRLDQTKFTDFEEESESLKSTKKKSSLIYKHYLYVTLWTLNSRKQHESKKKMSNDQQQMIERTANIKTKLKSKQKLATMKRKSQ